MAPIRVGILGNGHLGEKTSAIIKLSHLRNKHKIIQIDRRYQRRILSGMDKYKYDESSLNTGKFLHTELSSLPSDFLVVRVWNRSVIEGEDVLPLEKLDEQHLRLIM